MENRIEQKIETKKRGRPTKYQDTFPQSLIDFFSIPLYRREVIQTIHFKNGDSKDIYGEIPNDPPFFSKWCKQVGIIQTTMDNWVKKDSPTFNEEFLVAYNECKELQKQFLIINGLRNNFNAPVTIFTLKNVSDMRDEQYLKGQGMGNTEYHYTIVKNYPTEQKEIPANRIEEQLQVND